MKLRQQTPVERRLHVVLDVITDIEPKTSKSKTQIVSRRIVRRAVFAIPVVVVICVRHSDISQRPRNTKPKEVLHRIPYQQKQGDPDAQCERGQKASKHSSSRPPQNFNPAMQPGEWSVGQAIVNSAAGFIRKACVLKSECARPVAVQCSVLLREAMVIVHVMHLVGLDWHSVRDETHPAKHFVK